MPAARPVGWTARGTVYVNCRPGSSIPCGSAGKCQDWLPSSAVYSNTWAKDRPGDGIETVISGPPPLRRPATRATSLGSLISTVSCSMNPAEASAPARASALPSRIRSPGAPAGSTST